MPTLHRGNNKTAKTKTAKTKLASEKKEKRRKKKYTKKKPPTSPAGTDHSTNSTVHHHCLSVFNHPVSQSVSLSIILPTRSIVRCGLKSAMPWSSQCCCWQKPGHHKLARLLARDVIASGNASAGATLSVLHCDCCRVTPCRRRRRRNGKCQRSTKQHCLSRHWVSE